MLRLWKRMSETWTPGERGKDSKPPPPPPRKRGWRRRFQGTCRLWYLLSPDLRVLPCGSPVPSGVDLERRIVKREYLFLVF